MMKPLFAFALCLIAMACKDEPRHEGAPPPPPPSASATTAACAGGGGQVSDATSAPYFPRTVAGYCLDPHGEEKTYGDKAKLGIDALCTTALDGGCEEYKRFGVTRSVIVHYVANNGPASIEVFLSRFGDDGAYAIFTNRLTGEIDPADDHAARPMAEVAKLPEAAGALGTGKAYAQRGAYFVELTYSNDQETPEQLKTSSDAILPALALEIAKTLPSDPPVPASVKALPTPDRIANGVTFFDKDTLGIAGVGSGAMGFYKTAAGTRFRALALVRDTPDQAKDFIHAVRRKPGAMPVPNLGDEAAVVTLQAAPERPKIDWVVVRKGPKIFGIADEEWVSEDEAKRMPKPEKLALLRTW